MVLGRAQLLKSNEVSDINNYSILNKLINFNEPQFYQL